MDRVIEKLKEGYVVSFDNVEDFKRCVFALRDCGITAFSGCDDKTIVDCYVRVSTKRGGHEPVAIRLYRAGYGWVFGYCYIQWYLNDSDLRILNYEKFARKKYSIDFENIY